jgi:hypothetical protein
MLGYLKSMLEINTVLPMHGGGRRGQINVVRFLNLRNLYCGILISEAVLRSFVSGAKTH